MGYMIVPLSSSCVGSQDCIVVPKKNSYIIPLSVVNKDVDGNVTPYDLTGYTVLFMVKDAATDLDVDAAIDITGVLVDPVNGAAEVQLSSVNTDLDPDVNYVYEVTIINDSLNPPVRLSISQGEFKVSQTVRHG